MHRISEAPTSGSAIGAHAAALLPLMTGGCLCLAIALGGGTRAGFLSDALLQFAALPLLVLAFTEMREVSVRPQLRSALLLCLGLVLVPFLQLVPLPPAIWTRLPGRVADVESFAIIGQTLPWLPISVSPRSTALALISLIVPVSIFAATCQLSLAQRRRLSLLVIAAGVVSVFVGLMQVAQGALSPLRFFAVTNESEAVGFFANRNHFAALLYCVTLFAVAWTVSFARRAEQAGAGHRLAPATLAPVIATFAVITVLVAAQAMARSRAGLGLTMLSLVGALLLVYGGRVRGDRDLARRVVLGALVLATIFSMQFALFRVLARFEADPMADSRIAFARTTLAAAKAFAPFGSGIGSFPQVFAEFERPADLMPFTYVNRAHDDWIEMLLETGAAGVLLAVLCLAWIGKWSLHAWRLGAGGAREPLARDAVPKAGARCRPHSSHGGDGLEIDRLLARAATLATALLLLHSFVDYPLRTGAMMAVLAFALALLVPPPHDPAEVAALQRARGDATGRQSTPPRVPHRRSADAPPAHPAPAPAQPAQQPPVRTPWNADWPESWRKSPGKGPGKPPSGSAE